MHHFPAAPRSAPIVAAVLAGSATLAAAAQIAFAPPQVIQLPSPHFPTAILPVDLDGDGHLDLVLPGRENAGLLYVLMGGPEGVFAPPVAIEIGIPTDAVATADLDGDGVPDLVLAGRRLMGQFVTLRGRGDGTFDPPTFVRIGREPRGVALADLDGDGMLDAIAVNYGSASIEALRGDGLSFEVASLRTVGRDSSGIAGPNEVQVVDLDGDGRAEAVVPAIGNGRLQIASFEGDDLSVTRLRTIAPPRFADQRPALTTISIADFDGDGHPDVVVPSLVIGAAQPLFLFRNDGTGDLGERLTLPLSNIGYLWAAALADLDGDGRLDLVTGTALPGVLRVRRNISDAPGGLEFGPPQPLFEESFIRSIVIADVDGDGRPDLLATAYATHRILVFLNRTGDGVAGEPGAATTQRPRGRTAERPSMTTAAARGVAPILPSADRNGDGVIDALDMAVELAAWGPRFSPLAPTEARR